MPAPTRRSGSTTTATRARPKPQQEEPEQEEPQETAAEESFAEDPFAAREAQSGGDDDLDLDMGLDLSGTEEEPERVLLKPGMYDATVRDVQFGKSRKGNPMLTWLFAAQDQDGNEQTLFYHTVLNDERGLARTKKTINRLLEEDEEMDWSQFKPNELDWLQGRACRLRVTIQNSEEYGKSNSVRDVLAPREGFLN
jgi:hypothetical protein